MNDLPLDYSAAGVPVREDLQASHRALLDAVRRPGSWFTGAERIAIATESRHAVACPLCHARKQALSPEMPAGEHSRVSELAETLVDLAHRVRHDPARLSRGWFERLGGAGLEEGPYVEAVGIVSFVAGLDHFCRSLGIPRFPLPEPLAGEPSGYRPEHLKAGIAWVPMLAPEDAVGPEAGLYEEAPMVPNIARALSLVPEHVRLLQEETRSHYVPIAELGNVEVGRDLDRPQIELVAARVSALNECFY